MEIPEFRSRTAERLRRDVIRGRKPRRTQISMRIQPSATLILEAVIAVIRADTLDKDAGVHDGPHVKTRERRRAETS
jgi:hypothetical protein